MSDMALLLVVPKDCTAAFIKKDVICLFFTSVENLHLFQFTTSYFYFSKNLYFEFKSLASQRFFCPTSVGRIDIWLTRKWSTVNFLKRIDSFKKKLKIYWKFFKKFENLSENYLAYWIMAKCLQVCHKK